MSARIAIIQGHPDPGGGHFGHAVADAYAEAARSAGHEVRTIAVAGLDFPVVRSKADWDGGLPPPDIAAAQETIAWAGHLLIVYPLWLGCMPALLKAFLEQALRPGFGTARTGRGWKKLLRGRSGRIVVTMGMPAFAYRWIFGAHGVKALKRNILAFCGIGPVRSTLIGGVEAVSWAGRRRALRKMRSLGSRAA